MHKVRKNSLSPCYAAMNKENLPIENLTTPIGISFKTLEEARKKKTLDCQPQPCQQSFHTANPRQSMNQYHFKANTLAEQTKPKGHHHQQQPHTPTHHIQSTTTDSRREHDRSVDDYRQSLKSKDKQMSSLHSQVNTLNTTIGLLKEQVTGLKQENSELSKHQTDLKKMLKDKNEIIEKLKKQTHTSPTPSPSLATYLPQPAPSTPQNNPTNNNSNSMAIPQYLQITEKLNELQKIQDNLIEQNNQLRKKQQLHKAMLKNIYSLASKSLTNSNNTTTNSSTKGMQEILDYVGIILNQ